MLQRVPTATGRCGRSWEERFKGVLERKARPQWADHVSVKEREWRWGLDSSFQNLPGKVRDDIDMQNPKPYETETFFKRFKTCKHYINTDGRPVERAGLDNKRGDQSIKQTGGMDSQGRSGKQRLIAMVCWSNGRTPSHLMASVFLCGRRGEVVCLKL